MDKGEKEVINRILIKMFRFAKTLEQRKEPLFWELGCYLIDNLKLKI